MISAFLVAAVVGRVLAGRGSWWEALVPVGLVAPSRHRVGHPRVHPALAPAPIRPRRGRLAARAQALCPPRRPRDIPLVFIRGRRWCGCCRRTSWSHGSRRRRRQACSRCWSSVYGIKLGYEWTHYLVHSDYRPRSPVVPVGVAQPPAAPLQERALLVHRHHGGYGGPAVRDLALTRRRSRPPHRTVAARHRGRLNPSGSRHDDPAPQLREHAPAREPADGRALPPGRAAGGPAARRHRLRGRGLRRPQRLGRPFRSVVRPVPDPAETAVAQVRALGHDPREVADIALTHLDLDHVGGPSPTSRTPGCTCSPTSSRAALHPTARERARYLEVQRAHVPRWVRHDVPGDPWFGFGSVTALADDVLLVPLQGHTRALRRRRTPPRRHLAPARRRLLLPRLGEGHATGRPRRAAHLPGADGGRRQAPARQPGAAAGSCSARTATRSLSSAPTTRASTPSSAGS